MGSKREDPNCCKPRIKYTIWISAFQNFLGIEKIGDQENLICFCSSKQGNLLLAVTGIGWHSMYVYIYTYIYCVCVCVFFLGLICTPYFDMNIVIYICLCSHFRLNIGYNFRYGVYVFSNSTYISIYITYIYSKIYLHKHTTIWTLRNPKRWFLSLRRRIGMARPSMASTIWPSARRRSSLNPWTMMVSRHGKKFSKSVEVSEFDFGAAKLRNLGLSMFCFRWYTWFLTSRIGWIGCMFCVGKRATLEKKPFFPKQRVHTEGFLR